MNKFEKMVFELVIKTIALKIGQDQEQADLWIENNELIPEKLWPQIISEVATLTDLKNENIFDESKEKGKELKNSNLEWMSQFSRYKELNEVSVRELYNESLKRADRTIAAQITTDYTARLAIIEVDNFSRVKQQMKNYFDLPETPPPLSSKK